MTTTGPPPSKRQSGRHHIFLLFLFSSCLSLFCSLDGLLVVLWAFDDGIDEDDADQYHRHHLPQQQQQQQEQQQPKQPQQPRPRHDPLEEEEEEDVDPSPPPPCGTIPTQLAREKNLEAFWIMMAMPHTASTSTNTYFRDAQKSRGDDGDVPRCAANQTELWSHCRVRSETRTETIAARRRTEGADPNSGGGGGDHENEDDEDNGKYDKNSDNDIIQADAVLSRLRFHSKTHQCFHTHVRRHRPTTTRTTRTEIAPHDDTGAKAGSTRSHDAETPSPRTSSDGRSTSSSFDPFIRFTVIRDPAQLALSHYNMRGAWDAQWQLQYPRRGLKGSGDGDENENENDGHDHDDRNSTKGDGMDVMNATLTEWIGAGWWRHNLQVKSFAIDTELLWLHAGRQHAIETSSHDESDRQNSLGTRSEWLHTALRRLERLPFFGVHDRMDESFELFQFHTCQFAPIDGRSRRANRDRDHRRPTRNHATTRRGRVVPPDLQALIDEHHVLDKILYERATELFEEHLTDMRTKQGQGWKCDLSRSLSSLALLDDDDDDDLDQVGSGAHNGHGHDKNVDGNGNNHHEDKRSRKDGHKDGDKKIISSTSHHSLPKSMPMQQPFGLRCSDRTHSL